jgi:RNA polymerase sigma factor (sigma-70 family)
MSDASSFENLLRGIRAGDEQAATELVRQHEKVIRRQVLMHLTDPKLGRLFGASDICQMVLASFFLRAAAGQYDLDSPEQLVKLLVRMTRNKIASLARRQRAHPADQQRVEDSGLEEKVLADAPSPSTVVAQRELLHEVQRRLSAEERQLVSLRIEGHAWPAIAKQLGGTPEARRMQLTRALDRVEQQLGID